MNKLLILVVEADAAMKRHITMALKSHHYRHITADNGNNAIMETASYNPDVLILNMDLADMNGLDVIANIRSWSQIPIIVLGAEKDEQTKVSTLDMGADDFITIPFSMNEFLARLRVIERRLAILSGHIKNVPVYENADLRIDYAAGCAYLNQEELHLTPIEFRLLCLLAKNTGKVLTHAYLTQQVWGGRWDNDIASLRVYMAALRRKIDSDAHPPLIQTHVGVGYRMVHIDNSGG